MSTISTEKLFEMVSKDSQGELSQGTLLRFDNIRQESKAISELRQIVLNINTPQVTTYTATRMNK